jgi:hypothetical protein
MKHFYLNNCYYFELHKILNNIVSLNNHFHQKFLKFALRNIQYYIIDFIHLYFIEIN